MQKSLLAEIIAHKKIEVSQLNSHELNKTKPLLTPKSMSSIFKNSRNIIAEIKRQSPTKGKLANIHNALQTAKDYLSAGANGISVVTDEKYFAGSLHDLKNIAQYMENKNVVCLRKDFIIHELQIMDSVKCGADMILLVAAIDKIRLQDLIDCAKHYGLSVLLEVHDRIELEIALQLDIDMLGVNNRDLNTFTTDINTSLNLIKHIPKNILSVSESGIHTPQQAKLLFDSGFDALLIGEALSRNDKPCDLIKSMRG